MSGPLLWALVVLPALVGAGLLACGCAVADQRRQRRQRRSGRGWAAGASVTTAVLVVALAVAAAIARPEVGARFVAGSTFGLGVDALSAVVALLIAVVTLLVLVFAAGDVRRSEARFHGLMLVFAAAALLTATASTLPTVLFAWEVMGATSYALIGFWWHEEHRVSSGLTAFVTTRTADLGLYVAAGAALAGGSGLALADLGNASSGWRVVAAAGIAVAALGKAAQLPFSFWLSRAMDGPSPVSALLHSAAMVAMGGYLLLRVEPLLAVTGWPATAVAWIGAVTALLLGAIAIAQSDLKQLLAASTAAQLGFVVLAAGVGTVSGGTAHLVAHAATKALLFLVAGTWLSALGTKRLAALRGAARIWPVVGVTAAVGTLSLAGVAPLALWATKDDVLAAARERSLGLYLVGLAAAVVSAAYAAKVLVVIWRQATKATLDGYDTEEQGTRHVGWLQQGPLVVLALGAVVPGLLVVPAVGERWRSLFGEVSSPPATVWEVLLSAGLALLVLLVVVRVGLPEPHLLSEWVGLERVAHALVVGPTLAAAGALARFDDLVLDRGVVRVAAATVGLAGRVSAVDVQVVDGAVEALSRATRRAGRLAVGPQTGQIHQYFLQAVVALAVVALLLLVK